jgi:hypothetical protein
MQFMCKALPEHPLGYSLFARCAMNGQQMKVAQMFLAKGLQVSLIMIMRVTNCSIGPPGL